MISRAHFKNYRCLRDVNADFAPFTVLVGPNSSGKTTLLRGLVALGMFGNLPLDKVRTDFFHPDLILTKGAQLPIEAGLEGVWNNHAGSLRLIVQSYRVEMRDTGPLTLMRSNITAGWDATSHEWQSEEDHWLVESLSKSFPALSNVLSGCVGVSLDSRALQQPSYVESLVPFLGYYGENLASVVAYMAGANQASYNALQEDARAIIPGLKRIRYLPAQVTKYDDITGSKNPIEKEIRVVSKTYFGHKLVFDFEDADGIEAHETSEGTLLITGLLAMLHSRPQITTFLLDDLDRGLHPSAQRSLIGRLRALMKMRPDLQIICTSHSPYLLDCVNADEVRIVVRDTASNVHIGGLADHPDFGKWKDVMRPGEFWSTVGDKWLSKPRKRKSKVA